MRKLNVKNKYKGKLPDEPPNRWRRDAEIDAIVKELGELEITTWPSVGSVTAKDKDAKAYRALNLAGSLVQLLAYWAINHMVGLAINGRQPIPSLSGFENDPEYLAAKAAVDDHRHQRTGQARSNLYFSKLHPIVLRQIVINLLRANPGGFPDRIRETIIEGLEALDYSETLPIVEPIESNRKVKLRQFRLELEAVALVEYRCAKGMLKNEAEQEVSIAYGVSEHSLRLWEPRLRKELGHVEVSRTIRHARNVATKKKYAEWRIVAGGRGGREVKEEDAFSNEGLERAAKQYWQVLKESKQKTKQKSKRKLLR